MEEILYVIYEAFGGACSQRQALLLDEVTPEVVDQLIVGNYLRRVIIGGTPFLIVRHAVYVMADNANQNYRLTAYSLKKSCLLAEYWLLTHTSVQDIIDHLKHGSMYQFARWLWGRYMDYLHSQDCYARVLVEEVKRRYFVWFPKSQDPAVVANGIKRFFDNQWRFQGIQDISPFLEVRAASPHIAEAIQRRIGGRYWWVNDKLHLFVLNCPDTMDLI